MADLTTKYLGIELKNPIIIGSSGLTSTLEDIVQLEQCGAAAVVLKSIYEEEILVEASKNYKEAQASNLIYTQLSESLDYIDVHVKDKRLAEYLQLVRDAKKKTLIPIIGSINCVTDLEWIDYAIKIQEAGADALELNIFLNPVNPEPIGYEKLIERITRKVLKSITIPVSVKLSDNFTNLTETVVRVSKTGVSGIVMFNRFYMPDIDIYNMSIVPGRIHSNESEYVKSLRWVALLSDKIDCSIAASTGIHDSNTIIKQLLAGADAVQIVSALYINGKQYINQLLSGIEQWMLNKGFFSISQFKGQASYRKAVNPAVYERVQFMKHFGRIS